MSSFLSGIVRKTFSNFRERYQLENKNCIKVSKIFMGMGNVIVKKQVISSALALTVIAGDLEHLEQRQRKRKNKNSIPSRI